jgi:DinB superfamily
MNTDLRYPIGKVQFVRDVTDVQRRGYIDIIAKTPVLLREAISGLTPVQLEEPYRPGGWTIRQVVHHLPDSHMNAFIRFKLALTEDVPTIKPYDEARWAGLPDAKAQVEPSLLLLENLHKRWDVLLRGMAPGDFARKFNHPESGTMTLDDYLQVYAWHGRHHVAHITSLRARKGW